MRFAPVFALAAVSVCAVPIANNVVASAHTDLFADAALADVAVKGSAGGNDATVLRRADVADTGTLTEALANGPTAADVNINTGLANIDLQDPAILSKILEEIAKNNEIIVLKRAEVSLPANMDGVLVDESE